MSIWNILHVSFSRILQYYAASLFTSFVIRVIFTLAICYSHMNSGLYWQPLFLLALSCSIVCFETSSLSTNIMLMCPPRLQVHSPSANTPSSTSLYDQCGKMQLHYRKTDTWPSAFVFRSIRGLSLKSRQHVCWTSTDAATATHEVTTQGTKGSKALTTTHTDHSRLLYSPGAKTFSFILTYI